MKVMSRRLVLALSLGLALPLSAQAPRAARHEAETARLRTTDPLAAIYIVTSKQSYDRGVKALAGKATVRRNAVGDSLVMVEMKAHQLEDLSRHMHEEEHRCGGYFAFDTQAEALRFLRNDSSAQALRKSFVPNYTIDNQAVVNAWMPQAQEAPIRNTITHLSTVYPNRYFASSNGRNAALWIRDTWQGLANGRSDVSVELFTSCANCSTQPSVILTIRGNELADEIVVLGGHLDSISNSGTGEAMNAPGADDDASGIATLTEVLRVAMASGYQPKRTVQFMAYAAEEVGLRGSNAIAQSYKLQGKNVVGVLQMDMTNYASPGGNIDLITDYSNLNQLQFMRDLFAAYLAPSGYVLSESPCGYACSDHASWTNAGFPSGFFFEGPQTFPYLHTVNDRLQNMGGTADHSILMAKLGLAFLGEMGKSAKAIGTPPGNVRVRSNQTDYAIADNATIESPVFVYRRTGNAPAATPVSVRILHPARAELKVDLVAPDGTVYTLANRTGGSTANINETFSVNLSSEPMNGQWLLRVNDNVVGNSGVLDSWSITL